MEKKLYQKPELKIVEFKVEKGFADSETILRIEDYDNTEARYDVWGWSGWNNGGQGGNDNF